MVALIVAQSLDKVGRDGKFTDCCAGPRRLQRSLPDALLDADCARLPINTVHLQPGKLARPHPCLGQQPEERLPLLRCRIDDGKRLLDSEVVGVLLGSFQKPQTLKWIMSNISPGLSRLPHQSHCADQVARRLWRPL